MRIHRGHLLALASAACFGTLAISGKFAYADGIGVQYLMAWRFCGSAAIFWIYLLFARRPWPQRAVIVRLVLVGGLVLAPEVTLFFYGLSKPGVTAGMGETIFFIYPAWAVLFGAGSKRHHYVATAVAIAGVACAAGSLASGDLWGLAALLAASVLYAAYVVLSGGWLAGVDPWMGTGLMLSGAATTLLAAQSVAGAPGAASGQGWLAIASAVLVGTLLAYALLYAALRLIAAPTVAILATAEPMVALLLGAVLLGERLTLLQASGVVLIFGSVVYLLVAESRRSVPELH